MIYTLEICANSFNSALAAQNGGANRVELCDNLAEGGTTPSYAQIALSKQKLDIEIWPIIRPRGGDFLYSDLEFELMKEDIKMCKSLNCDGIVTGILNQDGSVDQFRMLELIAFAKPMHVAFHRAFDMSNDLEKALEDLIALGIVRVLTSGGAATAIEGAVTLSQLVKQANGRIEIMPGLGVNEHNLIELANKTGAKSFHSSAKEFVVSKMEYKNTETKMGRIDDEYGHEQSSTQQVEKLVKLLMGKNKL